MNPETDITENLGEKYIPEIEYDLIFKGKFSV